MRMYLKNNKKIFFKRKIVIFIMIIVIFINIYLWLSKNLNNYYLNYSENEASVIITNAISKAIDEDILKEIKDNDLYTIIKNKDDEIEMIDYDSHLVNVFLRNVTNNIIKYLKQEENKADNASFYIPMGSILQNPVLNGKGPKIPVKMELVGSVITGVKSNVKDYGINNSLIEIYVHVEVREKLILPVTAKEITIVNDLPISYKIIKGKIPNYYSNNGFSYMMPVE